MKLSIQVAVNLIVGLLFLASLISVYFALQNEATTPLTLVALANIIAVILLTFLITRGIIQPLRTIRRFIEKVGEGDYSSRIEDGGAKEMEEVSEAFNDMVVKVREAREEVQAANAALEEKVQERTTQLRELADSLEEKVRARTKELQEKVDELERFQRLAVGRELRMVELKDELRELEERTGVQNKQQAANGSAKKARKGKNS